MWITHLLMKERRLNGDLFIYGEYIPLTGNREEQRTYSCIFKSLHGDWYIVIIPLYPALLLEGEDSDIIRWGDTLIELPDLAPDEWISVFDNEPVSTEGYVELSEVMRLPYHMF